MGATFSRPEQNTTEVLEAEMIEALTTISTGTFPSTSVPGPSPSATTNNSKPITQVNYTRSSFPGMDNNTTLIDVCAARIIVDLERHYSENQRVFVPNTLLLITPFTVTGRSDNDTCATPSMDYVENYGSGHCELPPEMLNHDEEYDEYYDTRTVRDWVTHCTIPPRIDDDLTRLRLPLQHDPHGDNVWDASNGFELYYDRCFVHLSWKHQSCPEWIAAEKAGDTVSQVQTDIVQSNVSFMGGSMIGTVVERTYKHRPQPASIFLTDQTARFGNECWHLVCWYWEGVQETTEDCVDFSQRNLVNATLEEFVHTVMQAGCD